ncbi:MAG: ABC transporter permease [Patescibacteria group bacterium]
MNIFLPIKLAFNSLYIHKGRTALTILGIVVGIAAVIVVMSAGESLKGLVLSQVESIGTNYLEVAIKVPSTSKNSFANAGGIAMGIQVTTLTNTDAQAIAKAPNIKIAGAMVTGQDVISYQDQNKTINYIASSPVIFTIMDLKLEAGRFYTEEEDKELARFVVLGSKVASDLFGNQDALGQNIKIDRTKFKVVGVLKEQGSSFGLNFDDMVYLPVETGQKIMLGINHVMQIMAQMDDPNLSAETAEEITQLMRERHNITNPQDDDFAVTTAAEALDMINNIFGGITLLLVAIAGISLLVGGVGIMNIMYVSVTERTFEIGLRKAVGAPSGQVLWQFLWEAIAVTVLGGLVGIILGVSFSFLVSLAASQFGFDWRFILPPESVILAFSFCAFVGLVFGYFPALKAAKMNPISALGYEN